MSKKIIKLSESQLIEIIEKVITESEVNEDLGGMDDSHPVYGKMNTDDLLSYVKKGDIKLKRVKPSRIEDEDYMSDDPSAIENERIKKRMERQPQFESRKRR
jgi:hypothetical protein